MIGAHRPAGPTLDDARLTRLVLEHDRLAEEISAPAPLLAAYSGAQAADAPDAGPTASPRRFGSLAEYRAHRDNAESRQPLLHAQQELLAQLRGHGMPTGEWLDVGDGRFALLEARDYGHLRLRSARREAFWAVPAAATPEEIETISQDIHHHVGVWRERTPLLRLFGFEIYPPEAVVLMLFSLSPLFGLSLMEQPLWAALGASPGTAAAFAIWSAGALYCVLNLVLIIFLAAIAGRHHPGSHRDPHVRLAKIPLWERHLGLSTKAAAAHYDRAVASLKPQRRPETIPPSSERDRI